MPEFIYDLSDFATFWLLIGLTTAVSILIVVINKHFILYKLRYKDNTTIGSISALIGIIYGVLVGFVCLYLINNHDDASNAVQREANAVANVFFYSRWVQQPTQSVIKRDLEGYINTVTQQEWPLMSNFQKIGQEGDNDIMKMLDSVKLASISKTANQVIIQQMLGEIKELYNARHERINRSYYTLSPELWEVILVGTILIIAINYAFRVNFYLHLFSITAFSIMAGSMLFLLVTLDRPFQGSLFTISPDAFKDVLTTMHQT
jgi:hypothetical protein